MSNGKKRDMLNNRRIPNIKDGRFFVSPVLGCTGGCSYCYLELNNYRAPRKNEVSVNEMYALAQKLPEFKWGKTGTIISVGAWGDIFPRHNEELVAYSVNVICELLKWGNPVQIMSKNRLSLNNIKKIVSNVQFKNQLLYSSTITTLLHWQKIEATVSAPEERLETCRAFKQFDVPTNVLLKPFIPGVTDVEINNIFDVLLEYKVDFCTIGVMYLNEKIKSKINKNEFLRDHISNITTANNFLDCNGEMTVGSTSIQMLIPYLEYAKNSGIQAFLKSSCVNANVLGIKNPSDYYETNNSYCVKCGRCKM